MAAAFYNQLTGTHDASSAGTEVDMPGETLLERRQRQGATYVIEAMQDVGVDISGSKRAQLTPPMLNIYDKVINMAQLEYTPDWLSSDPRCTYWNI